MGLQLLRRTASLLESYNHAQGPGRHDAGDARRRGVRLELFWQPQTGRQLHRCCPGEHSSGNKRRVGGIDRMGNGRVRALLVEAVWRFLQWQPHWKAAAKMKTKLGAGTAMKKKTVIALARQLAIDLWRWRTAAAPWKISAGYASSGPRV